MRLKKHYVSREVTALTGLSARQLQWWDRHRLMQASMAAHRTAAGGFTERRYSPVDVLELLVLADLRRLGFTVARIRQLLDTLRECFGVRLFEATDDGGPITLLTDGQDVYARTVDGRIFNLHKDPTQPLLVIGGEDGFRTLTARARPRRKAKKPGKPRRRRAAAGEPRD